MQRNHLQYRQNVVYVLHNPMYDKFAGHIVIMNSYQ